MLNVTESKCCNGNSIYMTRLPNKIGNEGRDAVNNGTLVSWCLDTDRCNNHTCTYKVEDKDDEGNI